jgi:pilus assembly protein Flp/PilA
MSSLYRFIKKEDGATMVEYALMIAFVALACVAAVTALGGSVSALFQNAELVGAL